MENINDTINDVVASQEANDVEILMEMTAPVNEQEQAQNVESGTITQPNNINETNSTKVPLEVDKEPSKPPPKKRKRAKAVEIVKTEEPRHVSQVWDHFTRLIGSNPPRSACNYCGTTYATHPKNNGTSSMWAHLETLCKKYPHRLDKSQRTMNDYKKVSSTQNNSSTSEGKTLNCEELRIKLASMIIIDELPFKIVEGEGFLDFCRAMESRFVLPSRYTVARDCMKIFVEEKKKMKLIMKSQRVCLTTDTWTSLQNLNYMCLTAHWIDGDWNLQKRIINFCIVENHKGETLGKHIEECLIDWGIDRVLTITVDNASSNDKAISHLKRKCKWKDVLLNNDYMHMRCSAHIVNLIVKEGLEEQHDAIMRVRNSVKYVRSSPARLKSFKKCVDKEKIDCKSLVCLDVETRWNSTYLMLTTAEKFEKAFERLEEEDHKFMNYFDQYEINPDVECDGRRGKGSKIIGPPKEVDWTNVRNFVKFLKIFYNVTLKFSGSSYITSNSFFRELTTIYVGICNMINKGDYQMASMALRMKEKFNKYWGNIDNINWLLFIAILLDPRYKLKYVRFGFATMYNGDASFIKRMTGKIEDTLCLLYKQYAEPDFQQTRRDQHLKASHDHMHVDNEDDLSQLLESQFAKHLEQVECVESKSEVTSYLLDVCEKSSQDFDLLNWWKVNTSKYPVLSKVARDVLAIPVSTIASESAFSTSGRVIDPFRSSLSLKTVEALICTQNWLKSTHSSIDLRAAMEDMEQFEEFEKEFEGSSSFVTSND